MRKIFVVLMAITALLCFTFAACGGNTTYTITIAVDGATYGSVNKTSVSGIAEDTVISVSGNVLTIGSETITATASQPTSEYTFEFDKFEYTDSIVKGDITITAKFTRKLRDYTITFNDYDGTQISTKTDYHYGDTVIAPDDLSRDADNTYTYAFNGWDSEVVPVAGNTTYTATYTPTYIDYTITFKDYDGTQISTKTDYHYGDTVIAPSNPTRTGWVFDKWVIVENDNETAMPNGYSVSKNATIKATYITKFMSDNNISAHKLDSVDTNNRFVLGAGTHNGSDDAIPTKATRGVDQSYLAFNGNYGLDDYVVVDFTGDNMPYFSFFTGEVKNSMFVDDSSTNALNKCLLIINGFRDKTGANISKYDGNRNAWIRAYGIYGIVHPESGVSVSDGTTNDNIYLGYGIKAIQDSYVNTHFRMIVGYTDATANSVKANIVLINLDTKAIVVETSKTITFDGFSLEYFTGNIMLYGTFGKAITLDKVYAIEEDTTVDALIAKYSINEEMRQWAEDNNVSFHSVSAMDNNGEVILSAGKSNCGASDGPGRASDVYFDFANVTYNGNYGAGDYVVVDFTGDNMPIIDFFQTTANNSFVNESAYSATASENNGIIVLNGLRNKNNSYSDSRASNNKVSLCGPYGLYNVYYLMNYSWHDNQTMNKVVNEDYGMVDLQGSTTRFRMIAGFSTGEGTNQLNFHFVLINLDTQEVVANDNVSVATTYTSGIISMYGQLGKAITLDRVYAIEEDTTVDALISKYTPA